MCSLIIHHYNPWSIIWNLEVGLLWLYRGISFLVEENGVPGENHVELILNHTPLSTHCSCVEYPTANGWGLSHGTTLNVIP
jgi:hypothetical protein